LAGTDCESSFSFHQLLSLPQGGGAIHGIGETFRPNLFSGTGNFTIPIATSPGRAGFGPQLSLQHSTRKTERVCHATTLTMYLSCLAPKTWCQYAQTR
jgi:hypothetical protein